MHKRFRMIPAIAGSIFALATALLSMGANQTKDNKGQFGYVTDFVEGSVLRIDLEAGMVTDTIPTGLGAAGIAYVPNQGKMYVANQLAGTVTVILTDTNTAYDIFIDPGSSPVSATLAPDRNHMWVTLATKDVNGTNGVNAPGAIAIFDTRNDQLVGMIGLDPEKPAGFPVDLQFANGHFAYVALMYMNNPTAGGDIAVIDTLAGTVVRDIPVGTGSQPTSLAPQPNGKTIYVTGQATDRVLAVDVATGTNVEVVTTPGPAQIVRTTNGKFVWSANLGGTLQKIDTSRNAVVTTVFTSGSAIGIALSPHDDIVYVLNVNTATIDVVDASTGVILFTFSIGTAGLTVPIEMAIVQSKPVNP